jgi:hypothetical protein
LKDQGTVEFCSSNWISSLACSSIGSLPTRPA